MPASRSVPSWLVAGGSLLLGYLVARGTGVRSLGGLVLLAGVTWCWFLWRSRAGTGTAVGLVVAYATAFALSHLVARAVGGVPAVLLVASVVALLSVTLADSRDGSRVAS